MGPVSIGVEVQRNTDGDTPSSSDLPLKRLGRCIFLFFKFKALFGSILRANEYSCFYEILLKDALYFL